MKKILLILSLFFCFSCDPMNDKMDFENKSKSDIYVRMLFLKDSAIIETMVGLRDIKTYENKKIGKLYSWESEFEDANTDSLSIIVYKNYKFLNNSYEQSSKVKSDSLLKIGDFEYKNYTLKDLDKLNWHITYPNDGFKKGKFLNKIP